MKNFFLGICLFLLCLCNQKPKSKGIPFFPLPNHERVNISSPYKELQTYQFSIKGSVYDGSLVSYSVNKKPEQKVSVSSSGRYFLKAKPDFGENNVQVFFKDKNGKLNSTRKYHFFYRKHITAGRVFSVVIKDKKVYAWGRNDNGQLGIGSKDRNAQKSVNVIPIELKGFDNVTMISTRNETVLALKKDGTVWGWGYNERGELGLGHKNVVLSPTKIPSLSNIVQVETGYYHSLVLDKNGNVYSVGDNKYGELGYSGNSYPTFKKVENLSKIIQIQGGSEFSAALDEDGFVWIWGKNTYGNLGGGIADRDSKNRHQIPTKVNLKDIIQIAVGRDHILALERNGTVWGWGLNLDSQIGDGKNTDMSIPTKAEISNVKAIAANGLNSLAIVGSNLEIWGWGQNDSFQMGEITKCCKPALLGSGTLKNIQMFSAGTEHTLVRLENLKIYSMGENVSGVLANSEFREFYAKKPIEALFAK